ncbi:MAG: hypothetical protein ACI4IL_03895 [Eubacterium sp.]
MSSTYKTNNIQLNKWIESDIPKMEDFNSDNLVLDKTIGAHHSNTTIHITSEEREKWNKGYGLMTYTGTGKLTQKVQMNFGFDPTFCIVIATGTMPGLIDIENLVHYNYFGIATVGGSNAGLELSGSVLTVTSSSVMISKYEMRSYNEIGRSYLVIAFR